MFSFRVVLLSLILLFVMDGCVWICYCVELFLWGGVGVLFSGMVLMFEVD